MRNGTTFNPRRYEISDTVRDSLSPDDCKFLESVCSFFHERGVLGSVVSGIRGEGTSAWSATNVLVVISYATLRWHKPIERLTLSNFENPRQEDGFFVPPIGKRTALRVIAALERRGLLVRAFSPCGQIVHYGLNLKEIFVRFDSLIADKEPKSSHFKNCISRFRKLQRSPSFEKICDLLRRFNGLIINDISEVIQIVADLAGEAETAEKGGGGVATALQVARSDYPFFNEKTGKADPYGALSFWHKTAIDSGFYRHYRARITPKLLRQMRLWLEECQQAGETEEQIRKNIAEYVRKWEFVPAERRELTLVSKNYMPYTRRMDDYPNFEFFFFARAALMAVLASAHEPDKEECWFPPNYDDWL